MVIVFLLLNKSVLATVCIVKGYKMCVLINNQYNYKFPETFHLLAKPSELQDECFWGCGRGTSRKADSTWLSGSEMGCHPRASISTAVPQNCPVEICLPTSC